MKSKIRQIKVKYNEKLMVTSDITKNEVIAVIFRKKSMKLLKEDRKKTINDFLPVLYFTFKKN